MTHVRTDSNACHCDGDRLCPACLHEEHVDTLVPFMREWALDCAWSEEPEDIERMTDAQVIRGVQRNYDGGLAQFVRDNAA